MKIQKLTLYMISDLADYNAIGIYSDGKITVLKGSKIRKPNNNTKRNQYVNEIRNNPLKVNDEMIVLEDIEFSSPSTAAQFVADTNRNGLLYWRNKDNKKLRDLLIGGK